MDHYLVQAYDALGNLLDITGSTEGEPCYVEGTSAVLDKVRTTKSGILHDWDAETHCRKRIAYLAVSVVGTGVVAEVHITAWGRKCNVRDKAIQRVSRWVPGRARIIPPHWVVNI